MTAKRAANRRHFRCVAWFVALLLLGQLALGAFVDQGSVEIRDPEYAAKRDRLLRMLAKHPDRPWTLYLGSSRGAQGFAAQVLAPEKLAFNFAIPGGGPTFQRVVYERLRAEGVKPTRLLIEIMPIFFNSAAGDRAEVRLLDTARLSLQELRRMDGSAADAHARYRRWALARTVPEWRHDRELREAVGLDVSRGEPDPTAPENAIEFDGWQPLVNSYHRDNQVESTRLAHKQYDRFYPEFTPAAGTLLRLRGLIERAQADGVEVALVVMPEAEHFRSLASEQHRRQFNAFLTSLSDQYHVPLFDARDWVPDEEFFDGHHLLPEGGLRFTLRLKRILPEG